MKHLLLKIIKIYQATNSFGLGYLFLFKGVCRFNPTCSKYAYESIERYGTIKGLWLAGKRILRCNPFSGGGADPVPLE